MKNANVRHPFRKGDFLTKHHANPLSRFKNNQIPKGVNTHLCIRMWWSKHFAWHRLFGNATIDEVSLILTYSLTIHHSPYYRSIFRCKPEKAVLILERIKRMKK
jgi:hypothetical protein